MGAVAVSPLVAGVFRAVGGLLVGTLTTTLEGYWVKGARPEWDWPTLGFAAFLFVFVGAVAAPRRRVVVGILLAALLVASWGGTALADLEAEVDALFPWVWFGAAAVATFAAMLLTFLRGLLPERLTTFRRRSGTTLDDLLDAADDDIEALPPPKEQRLKPDDLLHPDDLGGG
jgi:MFS family permease